MKERNFGPCSKCSSSKTTVMYHAGRTHCSECRTIESCKHSPTCGDDGTKGEHLVVRCDRCRFAWKEAVS